MSRLTVVAVLRTAPGLSRGEYKTEHAVQLLLQIAQWWPVDRFLDTVLLTDVDEAQRGWVEQATRAAIRPLKSSWGGWWSKLEMFDPQHDDLGDILYFDLDTVIVGDLGNIRKACIVAQGTPILLRDFYRKDGLGSGLMYLPVTERGAIWKDWTRSSAVAAQRRFHGDQNFLETFWSTRATRWQDVLPGEVVSYKSHVVPNKGVVPDNARVVCFHGPPRPWQTPWTKQQLERKS